MVDSIVEVVFGFILMVPSSYCKVILLILFDVTQVDVLAMAEPVVLKARRTRYKQDISFTS